MAEVQEARISETDPEVCLLDAPLLNGIELEVQHPTAGGEMTDDLGSIGFGVILMPNGQPRVVGQIKHADGTSLCLTLLKPHMTTLRKILATCDAEAELIAATAGTAVRQ